MKRRQKQEAGRHLEVKIKSRSGSEKVLFDIFHSKQVKERTI